MEQGRAERLGVEQHAGADQGDADRMDDELLTRAAALVSVVLAGEDECRLNALTIDLNERVLAVLLDDREEIAQQAPLVLGQRVGGGRQTHGSLTPDERRAAATAALHRVYATCSLLGSRYLSPSWSRCW